ncbi:hypothetical protein IKE72_02890 [Candidatus Saccharibacteria bacterium]|nr:hypothetical protein [Candidatus Saccharibacteria bacterium]
MHGKLKIMLASLAAIAMSIVGSSMTIAYFTDTDGGVNNFVVGHASTALTIYDDGGELNPASYEPLEDTQHITFRMKAVNDGNIKVYQRFRLVLPVALADAVTLNLEGMNGCDVRTATSNTCENDNFIANYNPSVNGRAEYYIMSKSILEKNAATTEWPTASLDIANLSAVDQSQLVCENGANSCVLGVGAYSDAIQTTGFNSVTEAFQNFTETY